MKDIVIIANFVGGLHGTDNNRFPYLANMLCKDNSVELVASTFCHGEKACRKNIFSFPFKVTLLKEPGYKKNICLKRFWSHFIWGQNVLEYLKTRKKPDVVYCALPSLSAPARVSEYCNKNGIRFIVDVQDLWPEAFQMVFKVPVFSNIIFLPFKWLADKVYRNADEIVAVSQTYVERALSVNRKCATGVSVFLGTNLETFDDGVRKHVLFYKERYPKKNEIWVGYCGTLGKSYDLRTVIEAVQKLSLKSKFLIKLIVMGDGPRRSEFENYAKDNGIFALFLGKIPYENMCALLSLCDIVVNPIISTSVASIINKHADYAAVGRPVINTQLSQEYRNLINFYKMGFNCNNGDSQEMAEKIKLLIDNNCLRNEMGQNARKCAEDKFDRAFTYKKIVDLLK